MPGNSDHPNPDPQPKAPAQTAGEFTQIFSSGSAAIPPFADARSPAPASAEDDFLKMFASSSPSTSARVEPQHDSRDSEATLIFEAMPARTNLTAEPVSPRLPVAAKQAAVPVPASLPPAHPTSEFTQVFTALVPPRAPAPEVKSSARPLAAPSGEFTQFFSAISARENSSAPPVPAAAQGRPDIVGQPGQTSMPVDEFDRMFPQTPVPSAKPVVQELAQFVRQASGPVGMRSAAADDSTQIFSQPSPMSPSALQGNLPVSSAGESFTQVFRPIAPPLLENNATAAPIVPPQPAPSRHTSPPPPAEAAGQAWPAFGPPPPPSGSFTDVFAAQPSQSPSTAAPRPISSAAGAPASNGGGFTELFQAMPAAPQKEAAYPNFGNPAPPPAPVAPSSGWPATPVSQGAPMAGGSGDFTRLMQSLTPSVQGNAPASAQNDAFFAPPVAGGASYQESEFTRVQRASSQREAAGPAPVIAAAPATGAALAPGLAMAPANEKAAEKVAPAKKSKTLVILLVAMNILLLLVLIVIAFIVLRRK